MLALGIVFTDDDDEPIWQFSSSGVYSSQSLYSVINFRGIQPVFVPAVWKLMIPPRIHFFLWLLSNNKLLTRDNLEKRRNLDNSKCLFCEEKKSIDHLFYSYVVAKQAWEVVLEVVGFSIGINFESVVKCWLCNKKFGIVNMLSSTICWGI
jgi:hypothetical protein